jgi:hypothetical protein
MACGERRLVSKGFLAWCEFHWLYPCGLRNCSFSFTYPCGITSCSYSFTYPCVKWCHKWGVSYPCGVKSCSASVTYPCPRYCTTTWHYPCGFKYCPGTGYYPCQKFHEVWQYCYDFSSGRESCVGVVSHVTACCNGQEFSTWTKCLGYANDTFGPTTLCYDTEQSSSGPCTSASMPPGAPSQPIDPGSVAPHRRSNAIDRFVRDARSGLLDKLGRCRRCVRLALLLAVLSWLALMVGEPNGVSHSYLAAAWLVFSGLLGVHVTAFLFRIALLPRRPCNC